MGDRSEQRLIRKPFVLDCVSRRAKLNDYVSYEDKNLYGFFSKPMVRKQLRHYYKVREKEEQAVESDKKRKKKARHNSSVITVLLTQIAVSTRSISEYQGSVVELPQINKNGSVLSPHPVEEEELKPLSKGDLRAVF